MEHGAAGARLLVLIEDGSSSGREAVMALAAELGQDQPDRLIEFARSHLEELRAAGAVLGTLAPT
jgi:hypothetical protein